MIEPRPALLLTYSYLNQERPNKRRKRLMPVRELDKLPDDFDRLNSLSIFESIIDQLTQRHGPYLNRVDHRLLLKIIIILCGMVKNRLKIEHSLKYAEDLLAKFESSKNANGENGFHLNDTRERNIDSGGNDDQNIDHSEDSVTDLNDRSVNELTKTNFNEIDGHQNDEKNINKKVKRQVRFREDHEEFIFFERYESDGELIDDLNDKAFLDSMFKNADEDLNNNVQTTNYNERLIR